MRKRKYTEERIIGFLRQVELSTQVKELFRKRRFRNASLYRWRVKVGGMELLEARRIKALESGNGKLKKLLAEARVDIPALKSACGTKR